MNKKRLELLEGGKHEPEKTFDAICKGGVVRATRYSREFSLLGMGGFVSHHQLVEGRDGSIAESDHVWDVSHKLSGMKMGVASDSETVAIDNARKKLRRVVRKSGLTTQEIIDRAVERVLDKMLEESGVET